jgi:MFS family permease
VPNEKSTKRPQARVVAGERPAHEGAPAHRLIMMVTCINCLDRANLSVSAPVMGKQLNVSPATMGILFSAFGRMYTIAIPFAGVAPDRFGPRNSNSIARQTPIIVGIALSPTSLPTGSWA